MRQENKTAGKIPYLKKKLKYRENTGSQRIKTRLPQFGAEVFGNLTNQRSVLILPN
jgi:hypothetical protein